MVFLIKLTCGGAVEALRGGGYNRNMSVGGPGPNLIPTPDTQQIVPGGLVKQPSRLAGHHDEGDGEPVKVEDMVGRTDEGDIESHRGGRRQI